MTTLSLDNIIESMESRYEASRPRSAELEIVARRMIPGGTTRSILSFAPFPFRVERAFGSRLLDVDGHELVDFCGDYTAGLLGHNPEVVRDAIRGALERGWALGATHALEIDAAQLVCERFPSIKSVRFTNSGTEANLLAIGTAVHHTGRNTVVAFRGGFHGSVLDFDANAGRERFDLKVPHKFIVSDFNDIDGIRKAFASNSVGCVIVEPMQGAGGCVPATSDFLQVIRNLCDDAGAVLIFDEVMTSRLHPGGLQCQFGVVPDLTTLGKYLAGGLSFGAFGGRSELMAHFNNREGEQLRHSGTFNNNIFTMAAIIAVLRDYLTGDALLSNSDRGNRLREELQRELASHSLPMSVTGMGSMLHVHAADKRWVHWLFHFLLADGHYISPRGFVGLSFVVSDNDCAELVSSVREWASRAAEMWHTVQLGMSQ